PKRARSKGYAPPRGRRICGQRDPESRSGAQPPRQRSPGRWQQSIGRGHGGSCRVWVPPARVSEQSPARDRTSLSRGAARSNESDRKAISRHAQDESQRRSNHHFRSRGHAMSVSVSALAPTASTGLQRRLEAALTPGERLRIAVDLGSAFLAVGLLLVAYLFQWFGDPAQRPLTELIKAIAAILVSAPIFVAAIRGLITGGADDVLEQLVALAVLAAMATGEFTTAAFVP